MWLGSHAFNVRVKLNHWDAVCCQKSELPFLNPVLAIIHPSGKVESTKDNSALLKPPRGEDRQVLMTLSMNQASWPLLRKKQDDMVVHEIMEINNPNRHCSMYSALIGKVKGDAEPYPLCLTPSQIDANCRRGRKFPLCICCHSI